MPEEGKLEAISMSNELTSRIHQTNQDIIIVETNVSTQNAAWLKIIMLESARDTFSATIKWRTELTDY